MFQQRFRFCSIMAAVWLLSCAGTPLTQAQTREPGGVPPGPLTLDQVLALAEPRSEAVSIASSAVRRAEADEIRARSGLLPQLAASASYDRALASEFEGVFDPGGRGPECPPFMLNPQAPLDARVAEIERAIDCGAVGSGFFGTGGDDGFEDLPFGRKNTWRASLSFTQNLYSGGRNGAQISLAAAGHDSAKLGVTTALAQLRFEVTQAYYDAVLSQQLVSIAAATLEQAGATLRQVEVGLSAGTQPEFEALRARVARDTQVPLLIRQRVNRDLAFLRLKQLLDLPAEAELQLSDTLDEQGLPPPPVFAERVAAVEKALPPGGVTAVSLTSDLTLPERTAVAQAQSAVRSREASLRLAEAQKMPTLSLNSSYSRIAYPDNLLPSFDRSNWSVGVSMNVPILTGGRLRGDELVARAELEQSRFQRQQIEEFAALDTRSAWAELMAARAAWEATAGTVEQADRAYAIADVRYNAGVSTQLELSDARLQRQQAEANRAQAARDFQVARARVALLPDLPVTTGGGAPAAAPTFQQPLPPAPAPAAPQMDPQIRSASAQGASSQAGTR